MFGGAHEHSALITRKELSVMPHFLGMSIGAWIVLIVIIAWAVIAIKVYFFGGFKKKGHKASVGACCDIDNENCGGCNGCSDPATRRNAVTPIVKDLPKEAK